MSGDVAHKMWRLCLAALVLVACACAAPLPPHGLGAGTVQLHPRVTPPAPHETIQIYAPRTGTWPSGRSPEVKPGGELRHAGHLFRSVNGSLLDLGPASTDELAASDGPITEFDTPQPPKFDSWVLVLATEDRPLAHSRLHRVEVGRRIAYQGRIYDTSGGASVEFVRATGDVLARVVRTFERTAPAVIDVSIRHPDGTREVLTATPNHPFWVPDVGDYVALEDLAVGTVLRTYGGAEATVLGLSLVKGDVEVFDIEVEGLHNFFVRGPGSDAPGVLVHNSTGRAPPTIAEGKLDYALGEVASNSHNFARSAQNGTILRRLGIHNTADGRNILRSQLFEAGQDGSNVLRSFRNEHGLYEVKESILRGPGGMTMIESTWEVLDGGGRRLTTLIPKGG